MLCFIFKVLKTNKRYKYTNLFQNICKFYINVEKVISYRHYFPCQKTINNIKYSVDTFTSSPRIFETQRHCEVCTNLLPQVWRCIAQYRRKPHAARLNQRNSYSNYYIHAINTQWDQYTIYFITVQCNLISVLEVSCLI